MSWLDPRQWLLIAVLCGASALGVQFWTTRLVDQGDTAGYARAQAENKAATLKVTADTRKRETDLQTATDTQRKEKNDEINRLRSNHAAALERMRHRPERPTGSANLPAPASNGSPATGCTGAQLYRPDGQLLRGESLRAETVRLELKACYQQYEQARVVVNATQDPKGATSPD